MWGTSWYARMWGTSACTSGARGDTMKILVVDDDQPILDALTLGFQLQWQGATGLVPPHGEAGLRTFYEPSPDVGGLDAALPGKRGFEGLPAISRTAAVPRALHS